MKYAKYLKNSLYLFFWKITPWIFQFSSKINILDSFIDFEILWYFCQFRHIYFTDFRHDWIARCVIRISGEWFGNFFAYFLYSPRTEWDNKWFIDLINKIYISKIQVTNWRENLVSIYINFIIIINWEFMCVNQIIKTFINS